MEKRAIEVKKIQAFELYLRDEEKKHGYRWKIYSRRKVLCRICRRGGTVKTNCAGIQNQAGSVICRGERKFYDSRLEFFFSLLRLTWPVCKAISHTKTSLLLRRKGIDPCRIPSSAWSGKQKEERRSQSYNSDNMRHRNPRQRAAIYNCGSAQTWRGCRELQGQEPQNLYRNRAEGKAAPLCKGAENSLRGCICHEKRQADKPS